MIQKDDEADLFEIYSDPKVFKYFGDGVYTREKHIQSIKRAVTKWKEYGNGDLVAIYENKVIARLIIFPNSDGIHEVGYILNSKYWGNNLGAEIARGLVNFALIENSAEKVVASIREENTYSRAIISLLGFKQTHQVVGEDGISRIWYIVDKDGFKKIPANK
jgi:RimJ/RimL family protein N-acetyltransferase